MQEAIQTLSKQFPVITPKVLEYIEKNERWDLFHINPYALASKIDVDEELLIDWMLYAVSEGLFDLTWNTICPYCGANEHQHNSLNHLEQEFYCVPCNLPLDGQLDDKVEVAFEPKDIIKKLECDPFSTKENYHKYFFSDNFSHAPILSKYLNDIEIGFYSISPKQSITIDLDLSYELYRLLSIDRHTQCFIKIDNDSSGFAEIIASEDGFESEEITLKKGKSSLKIINTASSSTGFMIQKMDKKKTEELFAKYGSQKTIKRYLSGKEVLNRQVFRELFPIQELPADLSLRVGDVTLLFTDLKGSTAMYEEIGDIDAYKLVKDHFSILTNAIRDNRGALVKTIGDAVMAAFSRPEDGFKAAKEMLENMNEYSTKSKVDVGLKLGLHKGAAIAVNANQSLDYFGRTVNIAARVQGQASAGEVWLSEDMVNSKSIKDMISDLEVHKKEANLRGIDGTMNLYKVIS